MEDWKKDWSSEFVGKMQKYIETSYYKYGNAYKTYPVLAQAYKCIKERFDLYLETHNMEYLVDIANFAMLEYMFPSFDDAKYAGADSDKSPGLAGGISHKQLMEGDWR